MLNQLTISFLFCFPFFYFLHLLPPKFEFHRFEALNSYLILSSSLIRSEHTKKKERNDTDQTSKQIINSSVFLLFRLISPERKNVTHTWIHLGEEKKKKKYLNGNQSDGYHCFCMSISNQHFEMLLHITLHFIAWFPMAEKKKSRVAPKWSNYLHCSLQLFGNTYNYMKKMNTNLSKKNRGERNPKQKG